MNLALPRYKPSTYNLRLANFLRREHYGSTFLVWPTIRLLPPKKFIQPAISIFSIIDINGLIPLKRRWGPMSGQLHNYRLAHTGFAHICVEGVAQVVKPEIGNPCFPAGICKGLLDLLKELSPIRENSVMLQRSHLINFIIIS